MGVHAVLTGDIVNSTLLGKTTEVRFFRQLEDLFAPFRFEFHRGDSFQVYMKEPNIALHASLQCRAAAISIKQEGETPNFDVRISIGIGRVNTPVKSMGKASGEAFALSGKAFDNMPKYGPKLSIHTNHPLANEGFTVLASYMNTIFNKITQKQAEVIFGLLSGEKQQEIAKRLRKSRSTINQLVMSSRWSEIEELMVHYENIINLLI